MKSITKFKLLFILFSTFLLISSCGGDYTINYREKIIGKWELKNEGDLQVYYTNKPFILKEASMEFWDNGKIETTMLSSRDKKTLLVQTGTWTMPNEGGTLTIKSDESPFHDGLLIEFTDERTFYITLNDLVYQFVKV